MSDRPLSSIVLFLGDFKGLMDPNGEDDILALSQNSAFEYHPPGDRLWLANRHGVPTHGPTLCLTFDKYPYSPDGWVAGSSSETDKADIQIARTNKFGTSRSQFRVDIEPVNFDPRIRVLGQSMTVLRPVDVDEERRVTKHEKVILDKGKTISIQSEALTIHVGGISFCAWRPQLTLREETKVYMQNARTFCIAALKTIPNHFPSISSGSRTVPNDSWVGKGREYVLVESGERKTGTSASVVQVRDRKSNTVFAAKELFYQYRDHITSKKEWEALSKELDFLQQVKHPHIVEAVEIAQHHADRTKSPWLILEWIPNTLLTKSLDKRDIPTVATQMISALTHLHSLHIVHGDIKPGNILLLKDEPLTIKLADFAGAQQLGKTPLHEMVGTDFYSAPELHHTPREYNEKVDVFSAGIVLLECLSSLDSASTSRVRFSYRNHCRWMRRTVVPLVDEEVPAEFKPLLHGLLRKDPKKRWAALDATGWLSCLEQGPHRHAHFRGKKRPASSPIAPRIAPCAPRVKVKELEDSPQLSEYRLASPAEGTNLGHCETSQNPMGPLPEVSNTAADDIGADEERRTREDTAATPSIPDTCPLGARYVPLPYEAPSTPNNDEFHYEEVADLADQYSDDLAADYDAD